jgi:hypothetical protein
VTTNLAEHRDIAAQLLASAGSMTDQEREILKTVLTFAASELVPEGGLPIEAARRDALCNITSALAGLQPYAHLVPRGGISYRGRPDFMTDDLLRRLRIESRELRCAVDHGDPRCLGLRGGPVIDALARSREMTALIERHTAPVAAGRKANYLYYEVVGSRSEAHVDSGIFAINANIMLEHTGGAARGSFLYVIAPDGELTRIVFEPGEIVIIFAGSVVHGRAPLLAGEYVNNVTIGFEPRGPWA